MNRLVSLILSLAAIVAIIFIAKQPSTPPAGQQRSAEVHTPAQRHAPPRQHAGMAPVLPIPLAQQGYGIAEATRSLHVGSEKDVAAFDATELTARAGEVVSLTFRNLSDPRLHYRFNWTLVMPGKEGEVALESAQAGPLNEYTPDSPDVIARTRQLNPGESETIVFKAPATPGDYPYICRFPGHSSAMHGILHILPD